MFQCSKCKIEQPIVNYHKRTMVKRGHDSWCKTCKSIYRKDYFKRNKEKEVLRSRLKAWKTIGVLITLDEYTNFIKKQENKCAICDRETARLNVDHNHITGKVRELLCGSCNRGLGLFQDSIDVLKNAVKYLEKHEQTSCNTRRTI